MWGQMSPPHPGLRRVWTGHRVPAPLDGHPALPLPVSITRAAVTRAPRVPISFGGVPRCGCAGGRGDYSRGPSRTCPPTSRFTRPCTRLRSLCPPDPPGTGRCRPPCGARLCFHRTWTEPSACTGPHRFQKAPCRRRMGASVTDRETESEPRVQRVQAGSSVSNLLLCGRRRRGATLWAAPVTARRPPACQCARPARGPLLPSDHSDAPRPPNPPPSLPALREQGTGATRSPLCPPTGQGRGDSRSQDPAGGQLRVQGGDHANPGG